MAIFTPGPTVAAVSGSVGGTVYSRNAGGAYIRNRAVPVTSTTSDALAAKARMTTASQAWKALTDAQRTSWESFTLQNPTVNKLGQTITLKGNAMYIKLNTLLAQSGGTAISDPPTGAPPAGLTSMSLTGDIGAGDVSVIFAASPLAANVLLVVRAYVTNSAAINYVTNLLRTIQFSATAAATPLDIEVALAAKFGTLVVGQVIHVEAYTLDQATALTSSPLRARVTITTT